jgi:3-hydroxyisobutyrate dehydrogenase-like beta-hydroxyacid dehydrogenase
VNAISPQRVQEIGISMHNAGIDFVDGGIIGPPIMKASRTILYLSGPKAETVAECFTGGPLAVEIIGIEIGKASALKMCFAAHTKGTTALLSAILAAAEQLGVRKELEAQWSRNGSDYAQKTADRVTKGAVKAWRFYGEMEEIASTFEKAGLPGGFHLAAADIYERIAIFKNTESKPEVQDILAVLLKH